MDTETQRTPGDETGRPAARAGTLDPPPDGPVAAVMIATGIGVLVLGALTTLSEASEGVHEFLEFSERVGPLSGKTVLTAAAFFLSWGGLHVAFRNRELPWRTLTVALVACVAVGLVLTFPPFFQLFESD